MNPFQLALRVLRVDRRTRTSTILTGVGVAVATGLVLLLVSLPFATKVRAEREGWQQPVLTSGAPALLFSSSTDFTNGEEIARIDVAALVNPSTIDIPPGVPKFPGPGEVLVSPALAQRMDNLPASQLSERFGGADGGGPPPGGRNVTVVGTLGEQALRFPEQLVALVGHTEDTMPVSAYPAAELAHPGMGEVDEMLELLAGVGIVVLLVPSLVLVASASRLTAARREQRLAALRLAGATPGQVTGMVAAETGVAAVAGALLGLLSSPVTHALATLVRWDGGTWLVSDFDLPVSVTAAVVVAIPVLVVLAAALGLRRVVTNPIGAAAAHTRKPLRWWRLLALPVTGLFFLFVITSARSGGSVEMVLLALALVIGSAMLVGPWVTSAVGGIFVRRWRRPAGLLAGRRLRDDPRGAYRASAGVVLAVFTGSMALTLMPSFEGMAGESEFTDSVISVWTSADNAEQLIEKTNANLARYGQRDRASVIAKTSTEPQEVRVAVLPTPENREVVRTALAAASNGGDVYSREMYLSSQQSGLADLRRVTVIGLVAAAVLAGCSAAIATAGSVMDRRRTFGALIAAGTPVRVLARALRTEAALPAMVATIGAGGAGVLVGLGLFSLVKSSDQSAAAVLSPWILAPVVLGIGVALIAASVCTPVLNRVRAEPLAAE